MTYTELSLIPTFQRNYYHTMLQEQSDTSGWEGKHDAATQEALKMGL